MGQKMCAQIIVKGEMGLRRRVWGGGIWIRRKRKCLKEQRYRVSEKKTHFPCGLMALINGRKRNKISPRSDWPMAIAGFCIFTSYQSFSSFSLWKRYFSWNITGSIPTLTITQIYYDPFFNRLSLISAVYGTILKVNAEMLIHCFKLESFSFRRCHVNNSKNKNSDCKTWFEVQMSPIWVSRIGN